MLAGVSDPYRQRNGQRAWGQPLFRRKVGVPVFENMGKRTEDSLSPVVLKMKMNVLCSNFLPKLLMHRSLFLELYLQTLM